MAYFIKHWFYTKDLYKKKKNTITSDNTFAEIFLAVGSYSFAKEKIVMYCILGIAIYNESVKRIIQKWRGPAKFLNSKQFEVPS